MTLNASHALRRLVEGNIRFTKNLTNLPSICNKERREKSVAEQKPFAIILSCSDSRVPSEIVFDQGLGDLFVIRVAGNIVAPSIVGSVEFAASMFNTPLVLVMGHSNCGAVSAALEAEQNESSMKSDNIQDIVERIRPTLRPLIHDWKIPMKCPPEEDMLKQCIRANIIASVNQLKLSSPMIQSLIFEQRLIIVGAEYSLDSGIVEFLNSTEPLINPRENYAPSL